MAAYSLPRGTTWSIVADIVSAGAPVNLLGHRVLVTVRLLLVDGTTDSGYVWQGDSNGSGVALAIPSTTTTWEAGASIAATSYWEPTNPYASGSFFQCTDAGTGTIGTAEPAWPRGAGASTAADSNGVIWSWAGYINRLTVTMPPSATQALPNPVTLGTPMYYDIVDDDGAGGIWQTESGSILLTPRVTLTQP